LARAIAVAPPAADPDAGVPDSTIPPIYTYWGQFIDHDITANTDRTSETSDITRPDLAPVHPKTVTDNLRNLRMPQLDLDSLYGDGPTFDPAHPTTAAAFYDGIKFRLGTVAEADDGSIPGDHVPPLGDGARDLPRGADTKALIGDARNDENLIVAQLHLAFLRFHNAVVDWVEANEPGAYRSDEVIFFRARQLVRWHYQWLVVHDFLKTLTVPGMVDQILLGGNELYAPRDEGAYMPLEFSVASYRFGHSMVRGAYDYNRNFGRPGLVIPTAPFGLIFLFTGQAPTPFGGATDTLPFNWVIEWDRFVDHGSPLSDRFARKIDTRLAPPLTQMVNQLGTPPELPPISEILQHLAMRNLLRGYSLAIPTGQAVATALGVPPLTPAELQQGNSAGLNTALVAGGFLDATPLWFYVLKEAEVRANGNALGPVGSRIVAETLIGQIRADDGSYLNQPGGWSPAEGVTQADGSLVVTISDLLRVGGVLT
jgi:hypothetical protein